jgi:hypothetical protein
MDNLVVYQASPDGNGDGISIAVASSGHIDAIGPDAEVAQRYQRDGVVFDKRIDASGMSIVPGMLLWHSDSVTHQAGDLCRRLIGHVVQDSSMATHIRFGVATECMSLP